MGLMNDLFSTKTLLTLGVDFGGGIKDLESVVFLTAALTALPARASDDPRIER